MTVEVYLRRAAHVSGPQPQSSRSGVLLLERSRISLVSNEARLLLGKGALPFDPPVFRPW